MSGKRISMKRLGNNKEFVQMLFVVLINLQKSLDLVANCDH